MQHHSSLFRDTTMPVLHSLAHVLRHLPVAARALMVGAHPDDEDSALLAELALRHGVHAVYLCLTRGEGGQNRIGPETGAAFGILRTGELLASRQHDGAFQLLAPYIDFGYAKTAQDVFDRWGREHMVGTIVQAIREVQPDVLISVWTGTPVDGHGHHQASGITTCEAFNRAGDIDAFPEQLEAGLIPWQPRRLVIRIRDTSPTEVDDLRIDTGRWDPVLGRSCFEIAMAGRSLHRSQNMGALQLKGSQHVIYRVAGGHPIAASAIDGGADLFADLPLALDAWLSACSRGRETPGYQATETAARLLRQAWEAYHPQRAEHTSALLLQALRALREAIGKQLVASESAPETHAIRDRLEMTAHRVASAWVQASGIALEVLASEPEVVAGERVDVNAELYNRGGATVTLQSLQAVVQPGWQAECLSASALCVTTSTTSPVTLPTALQPGASITTSFRAAAPTDEETALISTLSPWLRLPSEGDLYCFSDPLPDLAPSARPILKVEAMLQVDDVSIPVVAPLVYRDVDPGFGEIRQPVRVRPTVMVDVSPDFMVIPEHADEPPVATVTLNVHAAQQGRLVLRESHAAAAPIVLQERHFASAELRTLHQELPFDPNFQGRRTFHIDWQRQTAPSSSTSLASYGHTIQTVDYRHIEAGYLLAPAQLSVTLVSAEIAPNLSIGYVPGTGDAMPQALAALGVAPDILDETALPFADLSRYDTIVIGVRALETRPLVAEHRERFWQYARSGGTLMMQYQKPREDGPSRFIPFPDVSMPRPVPRVSNERAPVTLIVPDDPLLTFPNRIAPNDFDDWVHERGLYFLATWPHALRPLLECADPGEPPRRGGLLHARLGKGHYIYCAYALFRQLPAGVPGAYRLLANLVSLPRSGC